MTLSHSMSSPLRLSWRASYIAAISMLFASPVYAGAWTQPEGDFYLKTWGHLLIGSKAYDLESEIVDVGAYRDIALSHYVEVGLTDDWTLVSQGKPVGWARYKDETSPYIGPLTLGIRRGFDLEWGVLGLEAHYGYQGLLGDDDLISPTDEVRSSFPGAVAYRPVVESHQGRLEAALGKGMSWGWITASTGVRLFSNETISPALLGMVQIGYQPTPRLSLDVHFPYNIHTGDLEEVNISGAGESNYIGVGVGVSWWALDRVGFNIGGDGVFFAHSNAATPAFMVGVQVR